MTLEKAKELGLDCHFFRTEEARATYLAHAEMAGKTTEAFEEFVAGYKLLVGAVGPRVKPVIETLEVL